MASIQRVLKKKWMTLVKIIRKAFECNRAYLCCKRGESELNPKYKDKSGFIVKEQGDRVSG